METITVDTGRSIITIHPGKLSDEERRVVLEEAAKRFGKAILKAERERGYPFVPKWMSNQGL